MQALHILSQNAGSNPTIPLQTVIWAIMASTGAVAVSMVGVIKLLVSFLPSVDAFFSSKKSKEERLGLIDRKPQQACDMTRDLLVDIVNQTNANHEAIQENHRVLFSLVKALEPVGVLAEEIKLQRLLREQQHYKEE